MKKVLVWRKSRKGFFYLLVCGALYGFALQIKSFPVTNHPPDNGVEYRIHEIRRATIPPTNTSQTNNGSDLAVVQQVTDLAKPKLTVFDEELFSDCLGSGYIDSSAYPLIDAQTIFCGSLARISKHGAMLFGVFSLTFAQNCSTLNIQECDYAIPLPERHFILLRDVTAVNGTLQVQSIGLTKMGFTRVLPLFRRNPSEGFYFLPRELSQQNLVTKMVRLLSDKCSNQLPGGETRFYASISSLTYQGKSFNRLCAGFELLGGSVRQAYLVEPTLCTDGAKGQVVCDAGVVSL